MAGNGNQINGRRSIYFHLVFAVSGKYCQVLRSRYFLIKYLNFPGRIERSRAEFTSTIIGGKNVLRGILSFLVSVGFISCFSNSYCAYGQTSKIEPESLTQGSKAVLTYNPKAEGAKLSGDDEVYVSAMSAASDGSIRSLVGRMVKAGEVFTYDLPLPPNVYSIQVEFVTLRKWDDKASLRKKVNRPDGTPARNASLKLGKEYLQYFSKEISLYPDNYQAYREKWFAAAFFEKEKVKEIVAEDLNRLSGVREESADLLYARNYGYLLLGQEQQSREAVKILAAKYPDSPLLSQALSDYSYQLFAQQIKSEGSKEIDTLTRELVLRNPGSELSREYVSSYASKPDFPLAVLESICHKWMQEEPDHPEAPKILAQAYLTHRQKLELASTLIEKSLSLFLRGYDRLYISRTGGAAARELPSAYLLAAEIAILRQKFGEALASIKAAQVMAKETTPSSHLLEAEVWEKLNDIDKSEAAYLEAVRLGSAEAEKALLAIYTKKTGRAEGFADYLEKSKLKSSTLASGRKEAKAFKATSLDGTIYDLTALRGKVIVLNYWFIGCAPCRVEMPGLNQLVAEFKDKGVVFLAPALDPADELRKFLKTATFGYTVIPDGEALSTLYEVNAYPTHVIIDKKGQIVGRLTGGNDKRHEQIRPLILRALAEP
jgi:peroxiredoxin